MMNDKIILNQEELRKSEEKEFHDARERDRKSMSEDAFWKKYSNKKWYTVTEKIKSDLFEIIASMPAGSGFLDLGCGLGGQSLMAAKAGLKVSAIDISPESVAETKALLIREGYNDFYASVMDAEYLDFPDNSFDLIVCSGVLHHMDVKSVFPQMARVLRPGGRVIALEALGYNPVIRAYRRLTPKLRTAWEPDHIITFKEINIAKSYFGNIKTKNYFLFSVIAAFFHKRFFFKPLLNMLLMIDKAILSIPIVKHLSWQIMVIFSLPKK
jgi:ubiquinone/menaquinone biosynthesis C-methylase UbiE